MFLDKFFENKHAKWILSLCLLIVGILILGSKYSLGGLNPVDYVVINDGKLSGIRSFLGFWKLGHRFYLPGDSYFQSFGNFSLDSYSPYFRPVLYLIMGLEFFIFKLNYFLYFMVNVFLHSINSVLFFGILNWFFPVLFAFLGALFFLFQGTLLDTFLHAYNINYIFTTTCLLLVIIFLKKYLYSNLYRFYFLSTLFFFLGQFTRDIFVVFPFILFGGVYLFYLNKIELNFRLFWIALKKTYLFFLISLSYLGILFYRISAFKSYGLSNFEIKILTLKWKDIVWVFLAYFRDAFGLSFLHIDKYTKFTLLFILIFLFFLFYLFFKIKKLEKFYVLFLSFSALALAWPILVVGYGVCYVYTTVPIVLFIVLFLIYKNNFLGRGKLFIFVLLCITSFGAFFSDKVWDYKGSWIKTVNILDNFAQENNLNSKSCNKFVFVVTPKYLSSLSLLQHLRLITGSDNIQVYIIGATSYPDALENLEEQIIIKKIKNGFRLVSLNKDISFSGVKDLVNLLVKNENCVGQFYIEELNDTKVKIFSFVFNEKWLKQNPDLQFFTWDFKNNKFCPMLLNY
ncbi:TPA: hypothetical protein DEO28_04985 [Candidatus Dependentiae bacterium]|nr:MAG: NADH dehydrogenase subunit 2 [candidate division TM6 bacterium GW2011_GWE2_31_21]KKP53907.1 MAG: NADH dehydrogenase subunit 2 [candidate division TM6 bacterium GW2011_GWF2_33_332]HBS47687.1 hypothetical protein [Candidatus Dependentiae bacterium]HBZ73836.1 hypothetical protein [Candidatus Dependentiae bacterium]